MKRLSVARLKPTTLARKRALIRKLIEQTGWAEPHGQPIVVATAETIAVEDGSNVIPFPIVRRD